MIGSSGLQPGTPGTPNAELSTPPPTLMPGFLDASGDITLIGIAAVWALTSLVAVPATLVLLRLRSATRPHGVGLVALAVFWPLPLALALVAAPLAMIRVGLWVLDRSAPIWLPCVEALAIIACWLSCQCREAAARRRARTYDACYLHGCGRQPWERPRWDGGRWDGNLTRDRRGPY